MHSTNNSSLCYTETMIAVDTRIVRPPRLTIEEFLREDARHRPLPMKEGLTDPSLRFCGCGSWWNECITRKMLDILFDTYLPDESTGR